MADNMPPMDFQNQDMGADPMDGGFDQTQDMENDMMSDMGGNEFDTNFDAGVEANEEEDTKEILDKIKADEDFETDNGDMQGENGEMDAEGAETQQPDFQQQQPNESSIRRGKKLEEIANDILKNDKEDEKIPYQQTKDKNGFRKKPFTSPNFKS